LTAGLHPVAGNFEGILGAENALAVFERLEPRRHLEMCRRAAQAAPGFRSGPPAIPREVVVIANLTRRGERVRRVEAIDFLGRHIGRQIDFREVEAAIILVHQQGDFAAVDFLMQGAAETARPCPPSRERSAPPRAVRRRGEWHRRALPAVPADAANKKSRSPAASDGRAERHAQSRSRRCALVRPVRNQIDRLALIKMMVEAVERIGDPGRGAIWRDVMEAQGDLRHRLIDAEDKIDRRRALDFQALQ